MTIGHAVVHYALAAHSFSAGIKCRHCITFFTRYLGFYNMVIEKFMRWKMSPLTNIFKCRNVLCEEEKTDSHIMWYIEKVCHNKVFLRNLITSHI